MNAQTASQTQSTGRNSISRHRWVVVVGLIVIALCVASSLAWPARSPQAPVTSVSVASDEQTTRLDPAQQSVMDYLQLHGIVELIQPLPEPLDPAQQSVMDYLKAHGVKQAQPATTTRDPAMQAVLDSIQAHTNRVRSSATT